MKKSITHIFFDLDRTLWDFERNSHEELMAIWRRNQLHQRGIALPEEFIKVYKHINEECWELYRKNEIKKEDLRSIRFEKALRYFGIEDAHLSEKIGLEYITNSPLRTHLIAYSIEVLNHLKESYELHIITNGFEEVQHTKIRECRIDRFFDKIITSEMAGVKKPERSIFDMALQLTNATAEKSVYIGDDLHVDVIGAMDAGWHAVYFNPHGVAHNHSPLADIQCLSELKRLF